MLCLQAPDNRYPWTNSDVLIPDSVDSRLASFGLQLQLTKLRC